MSTPNPHAAPDAAPPSRVEGKSAEVPGHATPVAASADDQLMGDLDREGRLNAAWLLWCVLVALALVVLIARDVVRT
jgi:hypothetical protein